MLADRLLPVPSCADCERIGLPMPPLLVRLEQDLGPELVGAFLLTRGGQELSIPSGEYRGPHPEVVGWFQRNVGFGKISIPIGPASSRTRLAWSIYNHLRDEASLAAVARALGVGTRTVSTHRARLARRGLLTPSKDPAR